MSSVIKRELSKQKKILHPNSRKVRAIAKKSKKAIAREHTKQTGTVKQNLIREKMLWMIDHMVPNICPYTPQLTAELIEKYIARNDEEIQWIEEKNKLPGRKNQSHASRKDILRMNKERELDDYNGCGIEIPNILNSTQCEMLREWDGDVRWLPNFTFRRFGKRHVEELTTQRENTKSEEKLSKKSQVTEKSSPKENTAEKIDDKKEEMYAQKINMETE
ncbi:hypothetical protein PV325_011720 [Microctonus aethiopoides]|nr:hypothetical protein PV325_011720 [Microctonus aethiopoides]KAK0164821.1 hypothetical protein PV328_003395 [Microctonus aethiopoides]